MTEGVTFCNQNIAKVQVTDEPAARLRREHTSGVTRNCNQNMTKVQVIGKHTARLRREHTRGVTSGGRSEESCVYE